MIFKRNLYLIQTLFLCNLLNAQAPDLTIILVIDQCTYRNLHKVRPYLKRGLRFLLDEGIYYTNAHTPYAWPATGPGHASLNTGTLPKTHGIISNAWFTPEGKKVACDDDNRPQSAVFGPKGLQPYGKSAHYLMVDGISDQLILNKQRHKEYTVCSVSLKSRSAICAANKLGKAIWFDHTTGMFTSSKAYFDQLPQWIRTFNAKHRPSPFTWHLAHTCMPVAYQFKGAPLI